MSRAPLHFRQRDMKAAIKAVRGGGLEIRRVELHQNVVIIIPGEPEVDTVADRTPTAEVAKPDIDPEEQAITEAIERNAKV